MIKAEFIKESPNPTYESFIIAPLKRFDERYHAFNRARWDEKFKKLIKENCDPGWFLNPIENPLYVFPTSGLQVIHSTRHEIRDWISASLSDASKKIDQELAGSWNGPVNPEKIIKSQKEMSKRIKEVAKFFGADLVGICELDQRWVYKDSEIPHKYAISIAVKMDISLLMHKLSYLESTATGIAYSKARCISTMLAQFIRGIGYSAYAHVNERVLEIPIAIDAGLGELGRNGLLITPEYGPNVRLCCVTTNLPLKKDGPIDFGVQLHCEKCSKCAASCPAQAIKSGERTIEINNISNRVGLLRWPINSEKCLIFWGSNKQERQSCAKCISICPFAHIVSKRDELVYLRKTIKDFKLQFAKKRYIKIMVEDAFESAGGINSIGIKEVKVDCWDPNYDSHYYGVTNPSGECSIEVQPGQYNITILKEGYHCLKYCSKTANLYDDIKAFLTFHMLKT